MAIKDFRQSDFVSVFPVGLQKFACIFSMFINKNMNPDFIFIGIPKVPIKMAMGGVKPLTVSLSLLTACISLFYP